MPAVGRDSVTVICATYGDLHEWDALAQQRAMPSVLAQTRKARYLRVHASTLAAARNRGAELAETEWLVFLDADDELDPRYVAEMMDADGDLRSPAVQYVRDGVAEPARLLRPKPIAQGNWMVIGTAVRRETVLAVGGFREWPMYEDWDLWWRCMNTGAVNVQVPGAVYRAHVRDGSRNEQVHAAKRRAFAQIRAANGAGGE